MLAKLPLHEFDSVEYDIRPPEDWITPGSSGTPARGLADAPHGNTWQACTAHAYDQATQRFQVMWENSGVAAQVRRRTPVPRAVSTVHRHTTSFHMTRPHVSPHSLLD